MWTKCIAAIVAAATVVGCGGSSSESPDQLSRAEFQQRAQAVCDRATKQFANLGVPGRPDLMAEWHQKRSALQQRRLADLDELAPPEAAAADFDRLKAEMRARDEAANVLYEKAAAQAADARSAVEQVNTLQRSVGRLAGQLGLRSCGT